MSDATCPYCDHTFNTEPEDVHQDETIQLDCPECEKVFVATVYYEMVICSEKKADCLNGSDHKMVDTCTSHPVEGGKRRQHCEMCGEKGTRSATQEEIEEAVKSFPTFARIIRG